MKPTTFSKNLPSTQFRQNIFGRTLAVAKRHPSKRFHQYRVFGDGAYRLAGMLGSKRKEMTQTERRERFFVLPGRKDVVVKLLEGDTFAMRRCVEEDEGIELWEETAHNTLPLPRSISAMVARYVPHMRSAITSFHSSEALSKGLKRRAKVFDSNTHIQSMERDGVSVHITSQDFGDKDAYSVVMRSDDVGALRGFLDTMPIRSDNTNIGEYLLTA